MTRRFGDRADFAVEIGVQQSPQLRVVDLWAAGKRLTTADNVAFVPFLARAMRSTAAQLRRRDVEPCPAPGREPGEIFALLHADQTDFRERFWFLEWGEIVDNVSRYAYRDDDNVVLVFAFWRADHPAPEDQGKVFVANLRPDALAAVLEGAADCIDDQQPT
ncbi:hypothetical protein AB0J80_11115 [Actinoplanes sp. NPDC049548]|uniref:hypothetical protein n=1 Tax=Actinoplanes sp. NPDC049548 TaxID=3155152 RepID=UPI00341DB783